MLLFILLRVFFLSVFSIYLFIYCIFEVISCHIKQGWISFLPDSALGLSLHHTNKIHDFLNFILSNKNCNIKNSSKMVGGACIYLHIYLCVSSERNIMLQPQSE